MNQTTIIKPKKAFNIIEEFNKRGFDYDKETSTLLREESEFWWFKQTILFFINK